MPRKKGTARYTEHIAVAVEPVKKSALIALAEKRGVVYSVVARWAIDEYLEKESKPTKSRAKSA